MGRHAAFAAVLLVAQPGCDFAERLERTNSAVQLAPLALDFGPRLAGTASVLPVTLTNTGAAPVTLSMRLERDARGAFSAGVVPTRLEAGEQFEVSVSYLAPDLEGADGVTLVVQSDTFTTAELVISISARSVSAPADAGAPRAEPTCAGGPPVIAMAAAAPSPTQPHLAWNGSSNLVVHHADALEAVTLSQAGVLSIPTQLMTDGVSGQAVFNGVGYGLIAWRWRGWTRSEVVFAKLTSAGLMVVTSERLLPRLHDFQTDPSIAWNPETRQYGVLWHEWDNGSQVTLRFARLSEDGALREGSVIELGQGLTEGSGSMLRFGGGAFVALQPLSGPERLRLVRITLEGEVGEVGVTDVADGARFHAQNVAWNGVEYGLSWVETRSGTAEVHFARVATSGLMIVGSERTLHSFPFVEAPSGDLVASGGGWLVAWSGTPLSGRGEIFLARLSATGELAPGSPRQLTCDPARDGSPVLSTGGAPTMLAFSRFGANGSQVFTSLIP